MKTIREELGLPVLVHTGLVHPSTAKGLAWAGVDCVMLDIIGHADTIREVCQPVGGRGGLRPLAPPAHRSLPACRLPT